jgi:hypothetical protein
MVTLGQRYNALAIVSNDQLYQLLIEPQILVLPDVFESIKLGPSFSMSNESGDFYGFGVTDIKYTKYNSIETPIRFISIINTMATEKYQGYLRQTKPILWQLKTKHSRVDLYIHTNSKADVDGIGINDGYYFAR